jgi:DNA-directed RNA polymerase II subunit RPB2
MTINQLIESVAGKAVVLSGEYERWKEELGISDATAFEHVKQEKIYEFLHQFGYQKHGNEVMYNGRTGEKMQTMIFIGPTYYQRLKHLVSEKLHSRNMGPLQNMTRQPTEGRSLDGGQLILGLSVISYLISLIDIMLVCI